VQSRCGGVGHKCNRDSESQSVKSSLCGKGEKAAAALFRISLDTDRLNPHFQASRVYF
ncbi:hypothetical protein NDU88_003724, partial [Pleurodeles waltl]